MKQRVRRDWTAARAKLMQEGRCRNCGKTEAELHRQGLRLECAHILGRTHDMKLPSGVRFVHTLATVPLCGPPTDTRTCHAAYDGHRLDLWPKLTERERAYAVQLVGEGQARRRIEGRKHG